MKSYFSKIVLVAAMSAGLLTQAFAQPECSCPSGIPPGGPSCQKITGLCNWLGQLPFHSRLEGLLYSRDGYDASASVASPSRSASSDDSYSQAAQIRVESSCVNVKKASGAKVPQGARFTEDSSNSCIISVPLLNDDAPY